MIFSRLLGGRPKPAISPMDGTMQTAAGWQDQGRLDRAAPPVSRQGRRILRAEAFHRLQVGLIGLVAVLMMVGLANIIMDHAMLAEAGSTPAAPGTAAPANTTANAPSSAGADAAVSEPLVELGIVPDLPSADAQAAAAAAAATQRATSASGQPALGQPAR